MCKVTTYYPLLYKKTGRFASTGQIVDKVQGVALDFSLMKVLANGVFKPFVGIFLV